MPAFKTYAFSEDIESLEERSSSKFMVTYLDYTIYQLTSDWSLSPILFDINTPFVMNSERFWEKTKNIYETLLSTQEKHSIQAVIEDVFGKSRKKLSPTDSNGCAKSKAALVRFVSGNEYGRCTLYFNSTLKAVKLGSYIIPQRCSFFCADVSLGVKNFKDAFENRFEPGPRFLVILDPAWDGNKSVKRKRAYPTSSREDIVNVCRLLKDLVNSVKNRQEVLYARPDIVYAVWTTEKYRYFTRHTMMEALGIESSSSFLWHKVTKSGLSAKVRGNKEYLIVASLTQACKSSEGVLISIPSAIHSHKPPLPHDLAWTLTGQKIDSNADNVRATIDPSQKALIEGLELYARYLRPGFHSIGNECLKLQHENLYIASS